MRDLIAFAFLTIALVSLPVGIWHTATHNSPGIIAGFAASLLAGCIVALLAD